MIVPPVFSFDMFKLTMYLLDLSHPKGMSKAKFFLSHGFGANGGLDLADAFVRQARQGWPGVQTSTPYAIKHAITGPIDTPKGLAVKVLTVWQIMPDGQVSFVTARPAR